MTEQWFKAVLEKAKKTKEFWQERLLLILEERIRKLKNENSYP